MRRLDVLILFSLLALIFFSWNKLQPPPVDQGKTTIDDTVLKSFSFWHGPIDRAMASTPVGDENGAVLGASSDATPDSLLPVEEYYGAPGVTSLATMLEQSGVTVFPEDIIKTFPDPSWGIGSQITIYRATPIEVTDWGKTKSYRTWQKSVEDFLTEQGIELGDNDRIEPKIGEKITSTTKLLITRVAITEVKVKEKIDFQKISREDPELPRGQTKVTKGKLGERTKTFRVTRENGLEVKRELLKNEITSQPENETTVVGTKVLIGKTYTGKASWYKYNSTKVASDLFKRGVQLRITNLENGKVIFVQNDGCICADTGYVVDLHPDHFAALGGKLSDGVMKKIKVDEVLN
jgi:hypothetical protein